MKRLIGWMVVGVLGALYLGYSLTSHSGECDSLAAKAQTAIANSKSCVVDEDCLLEAFSCPFPCYDAIGRSGKAEIQSTVKAYSASCLMMCPECPKKIPARAKCIEQQCTLSM